MVSANSDANVANAPNITLETCAQKFDDYSYPTADVYCSWSWDSVLCWPPTPAGKVALQKCPLIHGFDPSKFAERRCSETGQWAPMLSTTFASLSAVGNTTTMPAEINGTATAAATDHHLLLAGSKGWTNYTPCYTPELYELFRRINETGNVETIFDIAERTRVLEFVGLSVSLVALLISLGIFCRFRSLRNNRTRIHKNLFVAMCIQVIIRLTMYVDQAIIRRANTGDAMAGIDNTPLLCEASYVLLEYARTAMFMWMFIEGLYLHNVVTLTVLRGKFPHTMYALLGWGGPVLLTAAWTAVTAYKKSGHKCWWGYNFTPYYWILEGPRLAVILLNSGFLLNIVRVLVVKLRQSHTSDVEQVRKAVRAAAVLLPLLGITNLLNMVRAPLDRSIWMFAAWSYGTHFLTSFQGFCIAMIYCFLNGEVRAVLLKKLTVYMTLRGYGQWDPRRPSVYSGAYVTAPETDAGGAPLAASAGAGGGGANALVPAVASGERTDRATNRQSALSRCFRRMHRLHRWHRSRPDKEATVARMASNKMPLIAKPPATMATTVTAPADTPNGHTVTAAAMATMATAGTGQQTNDGVGDTLLSPESVIYM